MSVLFTMGGMLVGVSTTMFLTTAISGPGYPSMFIIGAVAICVAIVMGEDAKH